MDLLDEKAREKCLKEIALVQSLDHPNIIKHLESFIEGRELLLVLEYAEAGDLKRQLRKALERQARFDERVIWKYFAQVAEAMAHMHARRIMHRDLKPANVFLTLNGTVKVGDLGLGRIFSEQTAEAFSKVGTPLYMSPEVLGGKGYEWKSDVWSLGCVLYELAMLHSPFKEEGLSLYGLFQKITKGEYPPISEARACAGSRVALRSRARDDANGVRARTGLLATTAQASGGHAAAGPRGAARRRRNQGHRGGDARANAEAGAGRDTSLGGFWGAPGRVVARRARRLWLDTWRCARVAVTAPGLRRRAGAAAGARGGAQAAHRERAGAVSGGRASWNAVYYGGRYGRVTRAQQQQGGCARCGAGAGHGCPVGGSTVRFFAGRGAPSWKRGIAQRRWGRWWWWGRRWAVAPRRRWRRRCRGRGHCRRCRGRRPLRRRHRRRGSRPDGFDC